MNNDPLAKPGSVFLVNKEDLKIPINDTGIIQLFYDSQGETVTIKPGEPMYQATKKKFHLSEYFVSADLWEAQRSLEELRKKWGTSEGEEIYIAIRNDAPGVGDMIMATTIPKAFKEAYGKEAVITVFTTKILASVLENNPYIDNICTDLKTYNKENFHLLLSINDLELKCEPRWHEEGIAYKKNRTSIYLSEIGLWLIDKTPVFVLSKKEKEWAKKKVAVFKKSKNPLIGIQRYASCKARTYNKMERVEQILVQKGYNVVPLDQRNKDNKYTFTIRQAASIINECDVVVVPDSAMLHIAGALKKRIVGVFGHTDGEIFAEDYEKATVVQGKCTHRKETYPCWWKLSCCEGKNYKELSDNKFVSCITDIDPAIIVGEVERHLNKPTKLLITMLTYNNLNMTKKAFDSIYSWHEYDLFIVDNKSDDGTQEWLKEIKVDHVSKKSSVAEAQNIAIEKFLEGDYEFLLLLNNDLVLRTDYVDELVAAAIESGAGALAGTVVERTAPWKINELKITSKQTSDVVDLIAGDMSATILSRKCIEKVGKFDGRYVPRYIEDNDWVLRMRLEGEKFMRTEAAQYYHCLGAVIHSIESEKKRNDERWNKNIAKFEEKWGIHPHSSQVFSRLGIEHYKQIHGRTPIEAIEKLMQEVSPVNILVLRNMGGYGDILFTTVVGRALRQKYKREKVKISYAVPKKFHDLLQGCLYINELYDSETIDRGNFDFVIDLTDLEFRVELQEMAKFKKITRARTEIYLDTVGLTGSLKPDYFVTEEEKIWAEKQWEHNGNLKRIVMVLKGSNKLKIWSGMKGLFERLMTGRKYVIHILDDENKHRYSFRQAAGIIATSDLLISPDSGMSNLAGCLGVPVITIFSNRNGKIFARMFDSMIPIQGHCPHQKEDYCGFALPCLGDGTHRSKENIKVPDCLKRLSVEEVYKSCKEIIG